MLCACTEETIKAGLKKRHLALDTGLSKSGTKKIAAPKMLSVSIGTAERGGIICADCGKPFMKVED